MRTENIGILGAAACGKTAILKCLSLILKNGPEHEGDIDRCKYVEHAFGTGIPAPDTDRYRILSEDFGGEECIREDSGSNRECIRTTTVYPNVIKILDKKENKVYAVYAAGGDNGNSVTRMGIITVSRISRHIIAVFSAAKPLGEQLEFFDKIRYIPHDVVICITDCSYADENGIKKIENKAVEYFISRGVSPSGIVFIGKTPVIDRKGNIISVSDEDVWEIITLFGKFMGIGKDGSTESSEYETIGISGTTAAIIQQ